MESVSVGFLLVIAASLAFVVLIWLVNKFVRLFNDVYRLKNDISFERACRIRNDELLKNRISELKEEVAYVPDAKIAEQQNLINALNLAQSQANQNQYLVDQLRPCPTPAYITCNPWASNGTSYNGCCGQPNFGGCC